ncbi:MAG: UDP-N-acetylmuramate dehydrogenase [Lysobacterales bacterium]
MSVVGVTRPGLRVTRDVDLTSRNSLRLPARTDLLVEVLDCAALASALQQFGRPLAVLGGGSNVVLSGDIPGPVYRILGQSFECRTADGDSVEVSVDAGVEWDLCVDRCIAAGAHGIENLALIPGLAGAAPIQNIGAYGTELAECVDRVEAYDLRSLQPRVLSAAGCGFGYRDSRFKGDAGLWLVTRVHLRLSRVFAPRLGYSGLADELGEARKGMHSAQQVADAVRRIRRRKLPDPSVCPNAGSFFKNPTVALAQATALRERCPQLPIYPLTDGGAKLSAGWMIEACGLKGERLGDAAISEQHALVVINRGTATARDVLALQSRVEVAVREAFGVTLEREPVLIEGIVLA